MKALLLIMVLVSMSAGAVDLNVWDSSGCQEFRWTQSNDNANITRWYIAIGSSTGAQSSQDSVGIARSLTHIDGAETVTNAGVCAVVIDSFTRWEGNQYYFVRGCSSAGCSAYSASITVTGIQ